MERMLEDLSDEVTRTLDEWLYNNLKEFIPDKFDTKEKVQNNAEEVALHLEKRGIELMAVIPPSHRYGDKVVRQWTIYDTRFEEVVSSLTINLKTGNEVL